LIEIVLQMLQGDARAVKSKRIFFTKTVVIRNFDFLFLFLL